MYEAVLAKFKENDEIKKILISTRDELLVEATTDDYYWGEGKLGTVENILGKIWMKIRLVLINDNV